MASRILQVTKFGIHNTATAGKVCFLCYLIRLLYQPLEARSDASSGLDRLQWQEHEGRHTRGGHFLAKPGFFCL